MSEAEKLATDFIKGKRQGYDIAVGGTSKTSKGWVVKGTASRSEPRSHTSQEWEVTIEDDSITGYEFGKGTGWAFG